MYYSMRQPLSPAASFQVRTSEIRKAVMSESARSSADRSDLPLTNFSDYRSAMDQGLWAPRMGANAAWRFRMLALILATIGIYGVMAHSVAQCNR